MISEDDLMELKEEDRREHYGFEAEDNKEHPVTGDTTPEQAENLLFNNLNNGGKGK